MATSMLDKVGAILAWLFFQSNVVKNIYFKTVHSPHITVRVLGFTFIALVFVGRTSRQFWVVSRGTAALAAAVLGFVAALGPRALLLLPAAGAAWVAWRVSRQPGDGVGHRAGWEGYQGMHSRSCQLHTMCLVLHSIPMQ
jgi:hypothetical protein